MKTLVCILASTRTHELTWESFRTQVLAPTGADLVLCVGQGPESPFHRAAREVWTWPEEADWGRAMDWMQSRLGYKDTWWRNVLTVGDQWLGGIVDAPNRTQPGSAGILLFFRMLLGYNLHKSGLIWEYDKFIVTRSDFVYPVAHPPLEHFRPYSIHIPAGEAYGGVTDRYFCAGASDTLSILNFGRDILRRPDRLIARMAGYDHWNLERFLHLQLQSYMLLPRVQYFPYFMYAVRGEKDPTRWSSGQWDAERKCYIKYPSELAAAQETARRVAECGWPALLEEPCSA